MTPPPKTEAGNPDRDVTERLRRFARSRDPRVLWPALAEPALATARRAIEQAVRAVLTDEKPATLDAEGESASYAVKIAAFTTGTGALLGRWIEDGRLDAAATVRPLLARELEQGRRRAARIEREVLPAVDALLARGITPVVLKGFHTARGYCEEPGVRPCADVDLLVPPARADAAEAALREAGFEPTTARLRPYKRHWMGVNVDPRTFSVEGIDERNRWEIDLHESFDRRIVAGNITLDSERGHVAPFDFAGRALLATTQPLLLLVLACQISADLKSMRLMRLVDLVRVIRADRANGRLDWDEVLTHIQRTDSARFAYPALALAERLSAGTIEQRVLAHARGKSSWAIRRTVTRLAPAGDSADKTSLMLHVMWAKGPLDFVAILIRLLWGIVAPGPRAALTTCRMLLRRIAAGAFSFGRPNEAPTELDRFTIRDERR